MRSSAFFRAQKDSNPSSYHDLVDAALILFPILCSYSFSQRSLFTVTWTGFVDIFVTENKRRMHYPVHIEAAFHRVFDFIGAGGHAFVCAYRLSARTRCGECMGSSESGKLAMTRVYVSWCRSRLHWCVDPWRHVVSQ